VTKYTLVIKYSIFINKPREQVWDFTQDYGTRRKWDHSIKDAYVIESRPNRIIRLKTKGNVIMTFVYKQDERPYKTSLATSEVQSLFIESAGGSWIYEELNGGTNWTQRNTIQLKQKRLLSILLP
jgi:hypothetical protein